MTEPIWSKSLLLWNGVTPFKAISAGADRLVIGRPVTQNPDPKAAAEAILAEIKAATQ